MEGGDRTNSKSDGNLHQNEVVWSDNLFTPIKQTIVNFSTPAAYRGTGMKLDVNNEFVFPILKADPYTYANDPNHGKKTKKNASLKTAGPDITLVAGYQSRYNQRVVMTGSIDMCSDDFLSLTTSTRESNKESSNFLLCMNIMDWNFQRKSVLKAENLQHSLADKSLVISG